MSDAPVELLPLVEKVPVPVQAIDALDPVLCSRPNRDSPSEPAERDLAATDQGCDGCENGCDPRLVDSADDVGAQERSEHSIDAHTRSRSSSTSPRNDPNGTSAKQWESWEGLLCFAGILQAAAFFAKENS
jgi:hypothetical protein